MRAVASDRRRALALLVGAAACVALLGNRGFRTLVSRAVEMRRLNRELAGLRKEEAELRERIRRVRTSDHALETAARRELGYVKPGEVEYRFPVPGKESKGGD